MGPRLLKLSMELPTPSEPLTAPTVITPAANAWGETTLPAVGADMVVSPSPPTQSLRYLPASDASGVPTYTVYERKLASRVGEISVPVADAVGKHSVVPSPLLTQ